MMTAKRFMFYGLIYFFSWSLIGVSSAQTQFLEGTHYQRLSTPVPTSSEGKVEVVEAFWYGCGHCYNLEPAIETWIANKPENVAFTRLPAVLGSNWEPHARAYYAAEVLNVLDKIHQPLLEAIHAKKRLIMNENQLTQFFAEHGVDKDTFQRAYRSFAVETRLKRSQDLVKRYRLNSVPTIVVNGKYLISTSMAGSGQKLFEVVNFLVEKEQKG